MQKRPGFLRMETETVNRGLFLHARGGPAYAQAGWRVRLPATSARGSSDLHSGAARPGVPGRVNTSPQGQCVPGRVNTSPQGQCVHRCCHRERMGWETGRQTTCPFVSRAKRSPEATRPRSGASVTTPYVPVVTQRPISLPHYAPDGSGKGNGVGGSRNLNRSPRPALPCHARSQLCRGRGRGNAQREAPVGSPIGLYG